MPERDEHNRSLETAPPFWLPPWLAPTYVVVLLLLRVIEFIFPRRIADGESSSDERDRGHGR